MSEDAKPIYSHHVFLFPFRWDVVSKQHQLTQQSFMERTDFNQLNNWLNENFVNKTRIAGDNQGSWHDFPFQIQHPRDYNEYTYFYPHVRDALFASKNSAILRQLQFKTQEPLHYELIIEYTPWEQPIVKRLFLLEVEDITLNLYSTGIGIFAFHLTNRQTSDANDVLLINDFGRRIYPQFLFHPSPFTKQTKESFLPRSIALKNINGQYFTQPETFCCYEQLPTVESVFILPTHISELLGSGFITQFASTDNSAKVHLTPVIDDRMFVISWHANNSMIGSLKAKATSLANRQITYAYSDSEWWYKYIFIDGNSVGASSERLRHELIESHTYHRHVESGTLFGISRYSFVMLTSAGWFSENVLLPHIQTMYFQLVMLALVQRASIVRFGEEVTHESSLGRELLEEQTEAVEALHKKYIQFVNKLYFREVSAQEQGIELYNLLLEKMDIDRNVKDLNQEIDELHQWVNTRQEREQTRQATNLTKVATVLLPATLIAGILGMNTLDTSELPKFLFNCEPQYAFWVSILLILFITAISVCILNNYFNLQIFKKPKKP